MASVGGLKPRGKAHLLAHQILDPEAHDPYALATLRGVILIDSFLKLVHQLVVFGIEVAHRLMSPERELRARGTQGFNHSREERPDRECEDDASCEDDRQGGGSVYLGRSHASPLVNQIDIATTTTTIAPPMAMTMSPASRRGMDHKPLRI